MAQRRADRGIFRWRIVLRFLRCSCWADDSADQNLTSSASTDADQWLNDRHHPHFIRGQGPFFRKQAHAASLQPVSMIVFQIKDDFLVNPGP